jgi:hypothetical protein
MDTSAYGCPKNALCQESDGAMLVPPLATVPTPIAARAPLRITEGAVTHNERSKTMAKNARVDAPERHLWLARKGGSLGGSRF